MLDCLKPVLPLEAINLKYRRSRRCKICSKQFVGIIRKASARISVGRLRSASSAVAQAKNFETTGEGRRRHASADVAGLALSQSGSPRIIARQTAGLLHGDLKRTNETIGCNFLSSTRDRVRAASWSFCGYRQCLSLPAP